MPHQPEDGGREAAARDRFSFPEMLTRLIVDGQVASTDSIGRLVLALAFVRIQTEKKPLSSFVWKAEHAGKSTIMIGFEAFRAAHCFHVIGSREPETPLFFFFTLHFFVGVSGTVGQTEEIRKVFFVCFWSQNIGRKEQLT